MTARLLLFLLCIWSTADAGVRFVGNSHFQTTALLDLYRRAESLDQLTSAISDSYLKDGYFGAEISARLSAGDTAIVIAEGRRFTVGDLRIQGIDDTLTARLLSRRKKSEPVTLAFLESFSDDIVCALAEQGYPFSRGEVKAVSVADTLLAVEYLLIKGPRCNVGSVAFAGLRTTKPETLARRIQMRSGEEYRESRLLRSESSLSRLRFCRLMGRPRVTYDGHATAADILFQAADEKNITFAGFAYLSRGNTVAGQADLSLVNSLGRGEELTFFWSRQNELSRKLAFDLLIPYFSGYPLDLSADLLQEDRDTSFVSAAARIAAQYHIDERWAVGGRVGWEKITPEEGATLASARVISVDLTNRLDGRDDIRRTRKGIDLEQELISSYRKSFAPDGSISSGYSTRIEGDVEMWKPLSSDVVLYQRGYLFQTRSDFDPVPIDQLIPVGGVGSLRGYRENSFLATSGALSSTEIRWFALENLMLHLFNDNGYIATPKADLGLSGFGTGMEITTTIGSFRFDLSLGEEKELGKLLVHLGFAGRL